MREMTVKIDKYYLGEYKGKYYIFNRVTGQRIISIEEKNQYFNKAIGEAIIKELNTGNYEELEQ